MVKNIPIVILANKCDLKDKIQVSQDKIEKMAADLNAPFLFTSAKTGENNNNLIQLII